MLTIKSSLRPIASTSTPTGARCRPWSQFAYHALKLLMIILSALMIWKGLMVYTNSESPVVVVLR